MLFWNVVAPDQFSRAVSKVLASRAEQRKLAENVRARTGRRPGRAWRRWLAKERNWDAIVTPDGHHEALLLDLVREMRRPSLTNWRGRTTENVRPIAEELVYATMEQLVASLDPSRAVAAADARTQRGFERVEEGLSEINHNVLSGLGVDARAVEQLAALPPPVADIVRHLLDAADPSAGRILNVTRGRQLAVEDVERLLIDTPRWLRDAPADAWRALAEFAEAFDAHGLAADLFEQAADIAVARGEPLLRAALAAARADDTDRARRLADRAENLGAHPVQVEVVQAALKSDLADVASLSFSEVQDWPWACAALVVAVQQRDGCLSAISVAEAAVVRHPQAGGLRLQLAELLIYAYVNDGGRAPRNALQRAIELALEVRDARRSWGGRSAAAVATACDAAMTALDAEQVLRLGVASPEGDATPAEARDLAVTLVVAHAAASLGEAEVLAASLARVEIDGSPFDQLLLRGHLLRLRQAPREDIVGTYREAFVVAPGPMERQRVQMIAAAFGAPITAPTARAGTSTDTRAPAAPQHAETNSVADGEAVPAGTNRASWEEELAAALLEAAEADGRGDYTGAIHALRPWATRTAAAAELLAGVYQHNRQPHAAAEVLRDAGRRFGAGHLLLRAGLEFVGAGQPGPAEEVVREALDSGWLDGTAKRDAHLLVIGLAQSAGEWAYMCARAEAGLADLPDDTQLRWLLVLALTNDLRLDLAWQELTRPPRLAIRHVGHAKLAIRLMPQFLNGAARSRALLDVLDQFPDDTDVQVAAIIGFLGDDHTDVPKHEAVRWRELIRRFLDENPKHPAFFAITLPDDPDEMAEALRHHVEAASPEIDDLTQRIAAGGIPYGMLSAVSGKPYVVALLHRAAGCLPIASPIPEVAAQELAAARAALDAAVVIDSSTLTTAVAVPDLWPRIVGLFRTLTTTSHARADAIAAQGHFAQPTSGQIRWDRTIDRPVIEESNPEILNELRRRCTWVTETVNTLQIKNHAMRNPQLTDPMPAGLDSDDPRFVSWLSPLDLAVTDAAPFLCDDLGLRELARSLGVPTFGTTSLLIILEEISRVTAEKARQCRQELRSNMCVDLPFNWVELTDLAERQDWQPQAVAVAVARPAAWQDPLAAHRFINYAFEQTRGDVQAAAGWLCMAIVGFGKNRTSDVAELFAKSLLFRAFGVGDYDNVREAFTPLLQGARTACNVLGLPDLLDSFVIDMRDRFSKRLPPATAVQVVVHLTAGLPEPDRQRVAELLLSADR
jgi:hypothetical protein